MREVAKLHQALTRLVEVDVKQRRTNGFEYLDSRRVVCGSEHAFRVPRGLSAADVENASDAISAAVGAPVEVIDRGGAVVLRVVEKDFPPIVKPKENDIKPDRVLIGYDRLMNPVYHPLNTHILCGGSSNTGKTDGLRFWLWQLSMQGYDIRICDLKGFSFFPFEVLHQVTVAKSLPESRDMLFESISELLRRKEMIIRHRDRSVIKSFRPIVLIIDEGAALSPKQNSGRMKKVAEECDEMIALFGQQAREPRMFMIYSTQRPSVDVINLQFRANVEAAISFRCRDKSNSSLIIGREGAEKISPTTPGRCIYTFDRDYYLQVPYVGDDAAWEKTLEPLKTEVLQGGGSRRAETPRNVVDGFIQGSDCVNQTTSEAKRVARPTQKSAVAPTRIREGRTGAILPLQERKDMVTQNKKKAAEDHYSDEI